MARAKSQQGGATLDSSSLPSKGVHEGSRGELAQRLITAVMMGQSY